MSSEPLRNLSQWSDDKGEASGYASSITVSVEQIGFMSVNMADDNPDGDLCRRMEDQEQTSRAQREALENIKQMLTQPLTNRNNNDTGSNYDEEENLNNKTLKAEKSKGCSVIDVDVIKGIQAQIASLT